MTETNTKHPAAADTKPAFPKTLFQPSPKPPGFVIVTVTDEASAKALHPPGFATREEALNYNAPLEQPIPHITRSSNMEQFDDMRSQAGREIPSAVIRTEAPVQNVYIKTGIDPATLAVTAALPEGVDPQLITAQSSPGAMHAPPQAAPKN